MNKPVVLNLLVTMAMLAVITSSAQTLAAPPNLPLNDSPESMPTAGLPPVQSPAPLRPVVGYSLKNDVSPALTEMPSIPPDVGETTHEVPMFPLPKGLKGISAPVEERDPVLQEQPGLPNMPSPGMNFEGVNNVNGVLPPDTQGDIGYDPATGKKYYVQWVNLSFALWDVTTGTLGSEARVYGPVNGNTLWQGFGGPCETTNHGDPITLYDPLAHRWLMSQFSVNGPYYQCIAISTSANPTGSWYRYAFLVSSTKMNDYPKFGVWPDAYYMSVNQFTGGASWGGAGVFAFDRANMLNGNPATFVYFDLYSVNPNFSGMLPADLDGDDPPPTGSPNYFTEVDDSSSMPPNDAMRLWEFRVNWTTLISSTFGLSGQPNVVLPVASFTPLCPSTRNCIPQSGTSQRLDAIGDRLMYRLQYRNFGGYETLVTNHTVDAGSARAGVRWYELRKSGGAWSLYQQGTYAPADTVHRWMGSAALDRNGNMAVGYSVSSSSVYPSIRYTGRLVGDPLGTLPQGETSIIAGNGSQTHSAARWGDYSMMGVDPADDCTFWYTTEYLQTTGAAPWQTRIASFKFPSCSKGPQGTLRGAVSNASNDNPIIGAQVQATASLTQTGSTTSGAGGAYSMQLPVGVYTVTASAYGYQTRSIGSVPVVSGMTTTQNISLSPVAVRIVSGAVRDALAGWPLYAHLTIQGNPDNPPALYNDLWTDPVTGFYSVTLAEGITYTFSVNAWVTGYNALTRTVGPLTGNWTENMGLSANAATCNAPGYQFSSPTPAYFETFEVNKGGYVTTTVTTTSWAWGTPSATPGPGGAHSGANLWSTNLTGNYNDNEDGYVASPNIDLSAYMGQALSVSWWQWLQTESCCDYASVEVSNNGGSTWTRVYGEVSGSIDLAWAQHSAMLNSTYAVSNFRVRFRLRTDSSVTYPGWYVDDAQVGDLSCIPQAGGLVVGNTYDANTSGPLAGAQVTNDSGRAFTALATVDPAVDDSFYTLFSPAGAHVFTATKSGGYGAAIATPTVVQSGTLRQNLFLPTGRLSYTPPALQARLQMGLNTTLPLTLTNSGGLSATFTLIELDKGVSPLGPFPSPDWVVKPFKQNRSTAEGLGMLPASPAPPAPRPAGDVIRSWSSGLAAAWGIAYDAADSTVWVASPAPNWSGNNTFYEYTPSGALTGRSRSFAWNPSYGPADAAYNWNTGMLWVMNGDTSSANNCIYELDPASGYTGNRLCPGGGFVTNQRGLAYDPSTDTWYAGSWNDSMIHHFDSTGVMLDEVNVGLAIAGLAYNPDTRHLFVMVSNSPNPVYVLDAANNYAVLGQFTIPGFDAYSGAGLEIGCDGHLWAVNQSTETVYEIDSGEATSVCARDVPWLSESPISGTLAALSSQPISVRFDAGVPQITQPGQYHAQLKIKHNMPYNMANVPVTLTVTPPATWGKLTGTVTGLAHCDAPGAPLDQASMFVQGGSGLTWTLTTNVSGTYQVWLNAANSPLTLTTGHAGYITQTVTGINVTAQQTTTQNVSLRLDAPCASVAPSAFDVMIPPGSAITQTLVLTNAGAGKLTYNVYETTRTVELGLMSVQPQAEGRFTIVHKDKMSDPGAVLQGPAPLASGGPDPFGYIYKDSQEPGGPSYAWIEIAPPAGGSGITLTALSGVDDGYYWPLPLPFAFSFYGTSYLTLALASNGTVYFENLYLGPGNTPIPSSNGYGVNRFIAHLWDDLYIAPGSVYYQIQPDRIIIEYYHVARCCASPGYGTWELILFQNGNILFQYQDVTFGDYGDAGASATVGIQGNTTTGLQYLYNTSALMNTLAICYAYPSQPTNCSLYGDVPWLSEKPVSGTIGADTALPVSVIFAALPTMTSGIYTGTLVVNTNDTAHGAFNVPVAMTIAAPAVCSFTTSSPDDVGQVTVFTNTTAGDPPLTYLWNFRDHSPISSAVNPTHTYAQVGVYTVILTATNSSGTSVCTCDVSIEGLPVAGFVSNSPALLGNPVIFTNTTQAYPAVTDWSWRFGDGDFSNELTPPPHTYTNARTYTVTLTARNVKGTTTYTSTVMVQAAPVYGVLLEPPTAALSGTPGAVVTYTLRLTNTGDMADTFTLSKGSTAWTTDAPGSVGPLAAGAGANVLVVVHIPYGASGGATDVATITAASKGDPTQSGGVTLTTTATIACVAVSALDFAFTPSSPRIGQSVAFTGSVSAGTSPITYTWDYGDGSAPQVGNPVTHAFPLTSAVQTYTVTLMAANLCSQPSMQYPITVWPRMVYLPGVFRH